MAQRVKSIADISKFRAPYLPYYEVEPVVRMYRQLVPLRTIARRRNRDSVHVQQCVNKFIDSIESQLVMVQAERDELRRQLLRQQAGATMPSRSIDRSQPLTRAA